MGKRLVIMRGLPGSGKSTLAQVIAADNGGAVIVSADSAFMVMEGGSLVYKFNPAGLIRAHAMCQADCVSAMAQGAPLVIVDNTNTTRDEFLFYRRMAVTFNYTLEVRDVFDGGLTDGELAARNTHGVPVEGIRRMRERWEAW